MKHAVEIRDGYKCYGLLKRDQNVVLNQLDMTVDYGSIYALLGASGCGKTTLVSCIVGIKDLQGGKIQVLGDVPGTKDSCIPGPRVGYMPQEISLIKQLTINETIQYFGCIYGMRNDEIHMQHEYFRQLLEIPDGERQIEQCSGGEQRRVSFIVAAIHKPELLILDEPTVGLDPMLREKMWNYLFNLIQSRTATIIITTHYIEESKNATTVGFMRGGKLIVEDAPLKILSNIGVDTLSEAFLHLCRQQESGVLVNRQNENCVEDVTLKQLDNVLGFQNVNYSKTVNKMKALIVKDFVQLVRRPFTFSYCTCIVAMIMCCSYLAIGGDPQSVEIGVVNQEVPDYQLCFDNSTFFTYPTDDYECEVQAISCKFLTSINPITVKQIHYTTFSEAFKFAKAGKLRAVIHISKNFTQSFYQTFRDTFNANQTAWETALIDISLDQTDQQIAWFLMKYIYEGYYKFLESLMIGCNYPSRVGAVPLQYEKPIFGSFNDTYNAFVAPAIAVLCIFKVSFLLSFTTYIDDRLEGIWHRNVAAGVKPFEIFAAHLIVQTIIMVFECCLIVFIATVIFDTTNNGSHLLAIGLLILLGFCGIFYGLVISITLDNYQLGAIIGIGSFVTTVLLSGIIWPLEGEPEFVRYLAYVLPFALPAISIRNILYKAYTITHHTIYLGYLNITCWILIFLTICLIQLRTSR